jgi:CDP-diacylglycerol--glycerol-3-phosphate 3-phosphatidyltransferase
MNTPNKLTLIRVLMIPVFLLLLYLSFPYHRYFALAVFIFASVTDALDGRLARSRGQVTDFGKFMDPLADKLLVMAALVWFVQNGQMPAWVLLVVIAREFAVTALRLLSAKGGRVIAAGFSGKVKTAVTMIGICVMLTDLAGIAIFPGLSINLLCVGLILLTTLWSGTEYFIRNRDMLDWKT